MNLFKDKLLSGSTTRLWPQVAGLIFVALAYWVAVRLGLLPVAHPEGIASIWPASGLALAILLLNPKRRWAKLLAVIFVIHAADNWSGGNSLPVSLGFALANTLEPWLGAWALSYLCKSTITFGRTVDIFALLGVAILSNGLTALLGAAIPALAFGAPFWRAWWLWWAADGLGIILVTPFIVTWATGQNVLRSVSPRWLIETGLYTLVLTAFAGLLFGPFTVAEEPVLRNYMILPLLIWLAFRFSPRGMASALLLFATIALWNTLQGYGIFGFADQTVTEHLASVQMFLLVTSFSGLLLSALVTERQQAEALRESEEKYRTVADFTYDLEAWRVPDGTYRYVSPACERITGHTVAEFMADPNLMAHITHPDDQPKVIAHYQAIAQQTIEQDQEFDFRILTPSGEIRWISHSCTAVHSTDGRWLGRRESNRDITERKQAEEELRANRRQLTDIIEFLPDATLAIDREKRVIIWNKAIEEMTGIPAAKMIGQGDYAYTIPFYGEARPSLTDLIFEDQAEIAARYPAITREGDTLITEVFCNALYHDKGAWVFAKVSPLHDQSGNVIGAIESIRDITARKRAEETLQNTRAIIERSPAVAFLWKNEDRWPVEFVSKNVETLFGYTAKEFISGRVDYAGIIHPEDIGRVGEEVARYSDEKERITFTHQPYRIITKDGQVKWVDDSTSIRKDERGGITHYEGIVIDITARKQAEDALRESHAELQTRNEELDAFAHTVAHDLKNPLAIMAGYAELLLDNFGDLPDEDVRQALVAVNRSGRKAGSIIESLLLLASVRKQDVQAAPLDMAHIVDEAVLRLADSIQDSGAELSVPDRASWPVALGHAPWIEEIWVNYLSNAIKYGGPRPRIDLGAARQPDGFIRFSVRDYGAGLTPEQQQSLFAPFERLGQTWIKGHGLGLSVVRRIAEKLGGQVGVDSQPGTLRGSTFYFTLPAAPDLEGFPKP